MFLLGARLPLNAQAPTSAAQSNPPKASVQDTLTHVRADLFSAAPHFQDDVRDLKAVLAANPNSAEGHTLLGLAYRGLGTQEMLAEAVAELRQAIDLDPSFAPARFFLAHVYLDLGRPNRAKEELEAALEKSPSNPQFMTAALPFAAAALGTAASKVPVGLELYSVRTDLAKDLPGTVTAVGKLGYEIVEFYAPYLNWTTETAKDVRKRMDDVGLKCRSTHNNGPSFTEDGLKKAIELNQILGSTYIIMYGD